jgi:hypothetical protein
MLDDETSRNDHSIAIDGFHRYFRVLHFSPKYFKDKYFSLVREKSKK